MLSHSEGELILTAVTVILTAVTPPPLGIKKWDSKFDTKCDIKIQAYCCDQWKFSNGVCNTANHCNTLLLKMDDATFKQLLKLVSYFS